MFQSDTHLKVKTIVCVVHISFKLHDIHVMLGRYLITITTKGNSLMSVNEQHVYIGTDYIQGYQLANQTKYLTSQIRWVYTYITFKVIDIVLNVCV